MMLTELDKNKCVFATIAIHAVGLLANLLKIIADLKVCHKLCVELCYYLHLFKFQWPYNNMEYVQC